MTEPFLIPFVHGLLFDILPFATHLKHKIESSGEDKYLITCTMVGLHLSVSCDVGNGHNQFDLVNIPLLALFETCHLLSCIVFTNMASFGLATKLSLFKFQDHNLNF